MAYSRTLTLNPEDVHRSPITYLAFSLFATYLATGDESGTVAVWDVRTGQRLQVLQHFKDDSVSSTEVSVLLWAPYNLRTLFIGRTKGTGVVIPDVLSVGDPIFIRTATRWRIGAMDVDAVTRSLALTVGPEIQIARAMGHYGDYVPVLVLPAPRPPTSSASDLAVRPRTVQLNRGATLLFASYLEHGIVCWDVPQQTTLWQIYPNHPIIINAAMFTSLRTVFLVLEDGTAEIYRVGEHRPRLTVHYQEDGPITPPGMAILLNEGALAVGAEGKAIRIWNMRGDLLQEISPHGVQGHFSGMIAGRDARRASYLGCVVQELSAARPGSTTQAIAIFTSPMDRDYWSVVRTVVHKTSASSYAAISWTVSLGRAYVVILTVLLSLALAILIANRPATQESISIAVYARIDQMSRMGARGYDAAIRTKHLFDEASSDAALFAMTSASAVKQQSRIWLRELADVLQRIADL